MELLTRRVRRSDRVSQGSPSFQSLVRACVAIAVAVIVSTTPASADSKSFSDGLTQLIKDGGNKFQAISNAGGGTYDAEQKVTFYKLPYDIIGLDSCSLQVDDDPSLTPTVICTAYNGQDASAAQAAYSALLSQFKAVVGDSSVISHVDSAGTIISEYTAANGVRAQVRYGHKSGDIYYRLTMMVDSP